MANAEQEIRAHQAHGNFGIDARAIVVGTIQIGHFGAKPRKLEKLIDPQQNMVVGDQIPQRPGNEKLQLPALRPTQHRSRPLTDRSEVWGIFNSPQWTDFPPNARRGLLPEHRFDTAGTAALIRGYRLSALL